MCCALPGYCEGLPCSASVPAPALAQPHTTGQGRLLHQSHIRDNPRVSSMAGVGVRHFRPGLLLLSILTGVKHTEHPHQDTTSGRQQGPSQGTEIPCCIHPNAEHHLPLKISLQKGKKKSWQGARGLLCPRAAAVSCGSNASHTFKGTPTQLMDVSQPTVCVLTQPLCQGKTTVSVCGCVYIQRGRCLHFYSFVEGFGWGSTFNTKA